MYMSSDGCIIIVHRKVEKYDQRRNESVEDEEGNYTLVAVKAVKGVHFVSTEGDELKPTQPSVSVIFYVVNLCRRCKKQAFYIHRSI